MILRAVGWFVIVLAGGCATADVAAPDMDADASVSDDLSSTSPVFRMDLGLGFVDETPDPPPFAVPGPPDDPQKLPVPEQAGVLLADLDGDGRDEVVFSPTWMLPPTAPSIFRFDGVRLVPIPIALPEQVSVRAAADMDGDGAVDLVLDGPGILWGDGRGGFSGPAWFTEVRGGGHNAVALADLDGDGWLDIVQVRELGWDPGRSLLALLRRGPRLFEVERERIAEPEVSIVDSVGLVLLDGIRTLVSASTAQSPAALPPARFYRADDHGIWRPVDLVPAGPSRSPFLIGAPMGAGACDLDGDGEIDIVFALNPDTVSFGGGAPWIDRTIATGIARLPIVPGHVYPPMGWAFGCFDVDGDGRLDLIEAYGNDASGFFERTNDAGPQPIKAWRFDGMWRGEDLTDAVRLGRLGQWHSLSVGDIDGDGSPDFAVGGWGDFPRVFLNRTDVPSSAIRLRSRNGQPTLARVDSDSRRWDAVSISPLSQSDSIAFVTRTDGTATVRFSDSTATVVPIEFGQSYEARQP